MAEARRRTQSAQIADDLNGPVRKSEFLIVGARLGSLSTGSAAGRFDGRTARRLQVRNAEGSSSCASLGGRLDARYAAASSERCPLDQRSRATSPHSLPGDRPGSSHNRRGRFDPARQRSGGKVRPPGVGRTVRVGYGGRAGFPLRFAVTTGCPRGPTRLGPVIWRRARRLSRTRGSTL
jgi:hypothetical protein